MLGGELCRSQLTLVRFALSTFQSRPQRRPLTLKLQRAQPLPGIDQCAIARRPLTSVSGKRDELKLLAIIPRHSKDIFAGNRDHLGSRVGQLATACARG
jgi:hypothetical protein